MQFPRATSGITSIVLSLCTSVLLLHSGSVQSQEKADKPAATQSKETSSGASSGTTTTQSSGASATKLSESDEKMMRQLSQSHLSEIALGKLAKDKAQSEEVKSFAQKMVDDHTRALDDLKQLAQSKGVTLPTEADKQHKAVEKKLTALSGEKFDRQYMQHEETRAHRESHKLLERASNRAEDADLKKYASKVIGTVESHQQMAHDTSKNLKSMSEGKSGKESGASGGGKAGGSSGDTSSGGTSPGTPKGSSGQ